MSYSRPKREDEDNNPVMAMLRVYSKLLQERPILTKACTSAFTGALGNLLAQVVFTSSSVKRPIDFHSILTYGTTGFVLVGPMMHYYYKYAELLVPKGTSGSLFKRLLIDRFLYTPAFLFIYLSFLCILESHSLDMSKVRAIYWLLYKMNLKVLTLFQYINIKYVPQQYRVLFGNMVSIAWSCYVATKRSH